VSRARVLPSARLSRPAVKCRPATLSDFERIHALERRYNLGFRSFEEWSHLWVDNPACKYAGDLPIGWVLEDSEHEVVGSIGSVPFLFELNGRQLIAAQAASWVVEECYRGYAPLLFDQFLSQSGVDLYLCVAGNADAQPVIMSQCSRVPAGTWNRAAFWIANYGGFAASALAKRDVRFRSWLRYLVCAAMVAHDVFRRDALRAALRRGKDYEVRTCTAFDGQFDDFWETVRARNPSQLRATRSREVLEWHFKYPLARNAAWISTVSDGSQLLAYAVFSRKDVSTIGLRRVRLIDYQSRDGEAWLLGPMLADTLERCKRDGTAVLESIGWRIGNGDLMDKLAPHFRTLPSWWYFYKAATPALANILKQPAVWDPLLYDGDHCI